MRLAVLQPVGTRRLGDVRRDVLGVLARDELGGHLRRPARRPCRPRWAGVALELSRPAARVEAADQLVEVRADLPTALAAAQRVADRAVLAEQPSVDPSLPRPRRVQRDPAGRRSSAWLSWLPAMTTAGTPMPMHHEQRRRRPDDESRGARRGSATACASQPPGPPLMATNTTPRPSRTKARTRTSEAHRACGIVPIPRRGTPPPASAGRDPKLLTGGATWAELAQDRRPRPAALGAARRAQRPRPPRRRSARSLTSAGIRSRRASGRTVDEHVDRPAGRPAALEPALASISGSVRTVRRWRS